MLQIYYYKKRNFFLRVEFLKNNVTCFFWISDLKWQWIDFIFQKKKIYLVQVCVVKCQTDYSKVTLDIIIPPLLHNQALYKKKKSHINIKTTIVLHKIYMYTYPTPAPNRIDKILVKNKVYKTSLEKRPSLPTLVLRILNVFFLGWMNFQFLQN